MSDRQLQESIARIGWSLRRVVSLVYQDSSAMMKECGITGPQSLAMKCLHRSKGPLSSMDLSRALGATPANVTGIVDRLEERELVERTREDDDRRKVLLRLTDAGAEMAGSLRGPMEDKLSSGLGSLPPREIAHIRRALDSLIDLLGSEDSSTRRST
jgi:DNA-binding MarR family transcriptional regulator